MTVNLGVNNDVIVTSGIILTQGLYAHDAASQANPVGIGGVARTTLPTAVSENDTVRAWFDTYGRLNVLVDGTVAVSSLAGVVAVNDNSSTLSIDDGNGAITVDGNVAVTGSVTINTIGSGTNNIGDVDVVSVVPGTGATNLGKAIDTALGSTDTGVLALAVRDDTLNIRSGAENDVEPLHTDASGSLWVRPTPKVVRVSVTPTIDTNAYTSGDCLGGLQSISGIVSFSGGSGTILSVCVLDRSQAQRAAIDLLFFDRSVTVAGNNSPVAMSDTDMENCLGVISIGVYNTAWPGTPLNSFSTMCNIGLPFVLNSTTLYCQAVVRGTPTYAVGDLTFIYTILQD